MSMQSLSIRLPVPCLGVLALLFAGWLAPGAAVASSPGEAPVDAPHVGNGAEPAHGEQTLALRELWRAGGEDDDDVLFGVITQVQVDEDGNIYLLDTQLSEVQVFSPQGEHLKTLSRQGDGPGETQNPSDMLFMPGGTVGLVQTFPGKIIKIDRDGNPAGVVEAGGDPTQGGFAVLIDVQQGGGNLVMSGIRITVDQSAGTQTRTNFLASFTPEGAEKTRYAEKVDQWNFKDFTLSEKRQYFVHFRRWAVGPKGRVYAAPYRNRYAIDVYRQDGTLDHVIERQYASWQRTERYTRRVESAMQAQASRFPFEIKTEIEDTEPDISTLFVAADGDLWVRSSRGTVDQPDGVLMTYDVFDPQGHYDRRVAIACGGDSENDGLFFAGPDRVVRVTGFVDAVLALQGASAGASDEGEEEEEPAPMEVICYAIEGGRG